jgi:superfamily II DNA or RNA helicase
MTYAKAANVSTDEWINMNVEFIVMDEFHRAGALKWGQAVKQLTGLNKNTKILGTTATHIRFLDSSRDMATELFNNVCSGQLILATDLYSSQYLFSDSFGVSPPL